MKSRGPNHDYLFTSAPVVSLRCSSTLKEALFVSMEWVQSFSCIGPIVNKIFLCCSICWLYFILFFGILIPLVKRVKWNFNHFLFNSLTCKFSGRILFVMENFICHLTLLISSIFIQLIIVSTNQELLSRAVWYRKKKGRQLIIPYPQSNPFMILLSSLFSNQ